MLPNFIIAGATRCGTTSLYYYLKQHPDISFPNLKEPRYFSSMNISLPQQGPGDETVDKKLILTWDSYKKIYASIKNKLVGDASSEYLYHYNESADEIKKALGDIPIIFILRNPVDRAYSAYNNLVRDGREYLPFEEALNQEEARKKMNWDMMWAYKYVGLYYEQIKNFLSTFSKVKILIFEEFTSNPQESLKSIFEFLDADQSITVDTGMRYSHSGRPKNKLIGSITSRKNPLFYPLRELMFRLIPRKHFERIASFLFKKDDILPKTKECLHEFFKDDIEKLENLINLDLSIWKNTNNRKNYH